MGLFALSLGCAPQDAPPVVADLHARASALVAEGRLPEAWALLDAEFQTREGSVDELVLFAQVCQQLGRVRRGVRTVEALATLAPNDARRLAVAALLDRDRGRLADAVRGAERATELDDTRAEYAELLGNLRLRASDPSGAARAFEAALALDPQNPVLMGSLGRALVMAGDHAAGLPLLDQYLALRPTDALALTQRGLARLRARDLEGAEQDFRLAISLAPHLPTPYHNLAMILQRTDRAEEAEAMRAEHARRNDLDGRIRSAKRELQADPRSEEAVAKLVAVLREAGLPDEARQYERRLAE